jgi:hypothetical protein
LIARLARRTTERVTPLQQARQRMASFSEDSNGRALTAPNVMPPMYAT